MDGMSRHVSLTNLNKAYIICPLASCAVSYLDLIEEQNYLVESSKIEGAIQY
jgi:hypothetical protein